MMRRKVLELIEIVLGNLCIAFALSTLVFENDIICGGVSGIGLVAEHYFGLSVSAVVAVLNVALFLLGLACLGKAFAMTTLISTFLFPVLLDVFEKTPKLHSYLRDPLMAMVLAGCLIGGGIGLVLKANASTGGVDILALFINKKFNIPVHIVLNAIDITVLIFQISFSDSTHIIYGIVMTFITSTMLNKTLSAGQSLIQLTVISDSYDEIRKVILHDMDAGVTMLMSEKGYTEKNSKLVTSIIPYRKLPDIKKRVLEIDPLAFVIVSRVDEVGGKGFTISRV